MRNESDRLINIIDRENIHVVLLQEVCSSHTTYLEHHRNMPQRDFHFFENLDGNGNRIECASSKHLDGKVEEEPAHFGVGIGMFDPHGTIDSTDFEPETLPSPSGATQKVAGCGTREEHGLYVCTAPFTNRDDDPDSTFRVRQMGRLLDLQEAKTERGYRTIMGGDFNLDAGMVRKD